MTGSSSAWHHELADEPALIVAAEWLEPFRIDFRVCHDAGQCPDCIRRLEEVQ